MKKFTFFILLTHSLFLYSQTDLLKPAAWVRADSTQLSAEYWRDVSGNEFHLFPQSGMLPDTFTRMNFNKSFPLNEEDYFTLPDFPLSGKEITVMLVYQVEDTLSENSLWSLQLDSTTRVGLTTQRIVCERGSIRYADTNRLLPIVNTLRHSWKEKHETGNLLIGRCDSIPFQGKIAECLVFDGGISDTLLVQYISYLSVKYGITLFKTDYLSSDRTVIWDYHNNPDYSYSIAGIGKDLTMGLEQKQSYMLDEKIIIGLSSLAPTNEENDAILHQGDYLIWGFDNTLLDRYGTVYLEDGFELEVYGNGLLQATGTGASSLNTFMQVDASQWADEDLQEYYLLIDRSGTGQFLPAHVEFYMPDYVDSNTLYFSNIYWDTDNNGKDRFCFAKIPFDSLFVNKSVVVNGGNDRRGNYAETKGKTPHNQPKTSPQQSSEKPAAKNSYLLFPNPNKGKFTVEIHYAEISDITIKTYSPDGKIITVWSAQNQSSYHYQGEVSVKGQYLIDIEGGGERKSLKMIVQ